MATTIAAPRLISFKAVGMLGYLRFLRSDNPSEFSDFRTKPNLFFFDFTASRRHRRHFGTAFAYGQTSSGKTFTMTGSETDPGIIRRSVRDVFENMISDREFLIRVSYMEIFNEEINDLLAVENQRLQIHEHLERGVFVAGLKEEIVCDAEQILKLIDSGEEDIHPEEREAIEEAVMCMSNALRVGDWYEASTTNKRKRREEPTEWSE